MGKKTEPTPAETAAAFVEIMKELRPKVQEIFGADVHHEIALQVYDISSAALEIDEDIDVLAELKQAKELAQQIFGDAVSPETVLGVYGRIFEGEDDED